ncbi:MAG: DUF4476 domain-containing protein [Bacteroidales bacterium]|nr:DUF4476 domain-containing protein [Bacteroidales bacterium]
MKRLIIIAIAILLTPCLMAQPGGTHHNFHQQNPQHQNVPNPHHPTQLFHSVSLIAEHGEEFVVYVDGDIVNKRASSSVLVQNLTPQFHDIYVVLKRPVDKIALIRYQPNMLVENFFVSYNTMTGRLELRSMQPQPVTPQVQPPHICTFEEVERMYNALKSESFDETRLSLAKTMVSHNNMAAHQIKRLAESFTFDSNKLSFLKYAYAYCIDQQNYYECAEVLTFSSDKEKLLRFISH